MNVSDLRTCPRISVLIVTLVSVVATVPAALAQDTETDDRVQMDERPMTIPTYQMGPAETYPMFYANESYQGAQKRIYPYAMQDHLIHERQDQNYTSLWLENQFVKICVLPEIGGRLFVATDKTNDYDFFYRQHVIKPALIGMLGAWISGGVEWCAFHHHRNTTFMTIDHTLVENDDGSKTIWLGETERRHRMKWLIGLTLHPDRSYIETSVTFFNRTALPNSILYWANVAVHVNDQYQVIFPPSVQVATYHSKIDFTNWPIARGEYRGFDYSGRDISRWKNSPVSNSFFAWQLQENFMGGYDHSRDAGVVHVGDHHVVCGAKLWEWGTGSVGRAWDKILTDGDGPYAELMVGAFSDNQPDYSWIKPHEVKTFKHYWYPVRAIGGFKNANLEGAVNLEMRDDDSVFVGFHTTSQHRQAHASVTCGDTTLLHKMIDIGPDQPFAQTLTIPSGTTANELRAVITDSEGNELVSYQPQSRQAVDELPAPVKAPPKPAEIESIEELYLTGLRIQQIHNPRVDPLDYYLEGLKRDPGDSRCNTMVGIEYNRRGMYTQAEEHLRRAVDRLTLDYTRARGGEAHYQLGVALRRQRRFTEAYEQFARASWDQAFHAAANYELAAIACMQGDLDRALQHTERALSTNQRDSKAHNLRATILRKLDHAEQAARQVTGVLRTDPLNFWARNELCACQFSQQDVTAARNQHQELAELMRGDVQSYLELACDYMNAGFWADARNVLQLPLKDDLRPADSYPLLHYYLGYVAQQMGDQAEACQHFKTASAQPVDYCFPFRWESHDVLLAALAANPSDARVEYYLGSLLFDNQPEVAMEHWARSRQLDSSLAVVHRNAGWASYRVKSDVSKAIDCYEDGLACQDLNPRLLLELDLLYEEANVNPQRRLEVLQENHSVVFRREESFLREIEVLVLTGNYRRAIGFLENNFFHAQEGRSGIHDIYVDAHLLEGIARLEQDQARVALQHFLRAAEYPENLSVGRPKDDPRTAKIAYFTGQAHQGLGNDQKAREFYQKGVDQKNTQRWPEAQFYQALCLNELDRAEEAKLAFQRLIEAGKQRLAEQESADFFAKFGQRASLRKRNAAAYYHIGLGAMGQENLSQARDALSKATELDLSLPWARHYLDALTARSE